MSITYNQCCGRCGLRINRDNLHQFGEEPGKCCCSPEEQGDFIKAIDEEVIQASFPSDTGIGCPQEIAIAVTPRRDPAFAYRMDLPERRVGIDPKLVDEIRQSLQVILSESDNLRARISQFGISDNDIRASAAAIQAGVERIEAMISGRSQ